MLKNVGLWTIYFKFRNLDVLWVLFKLNTHSIIQRMSTTAIYSSHSKYQILFPISGLSRTAMRHNCNQDIDRMGMT